MKKHLKIHRFEPRSEEWFAYRQNYINASEVGGLLGHSKYTCPSQIYYEKLGVLKNRNADNEATFHGFHLEEYVANLWPYYNHNAPMEYIHNFKAQKVLRKCKNINGSIVNPDYPWLSVSLDRAINKGMLNLITGELTKDECPLEIKTISGHVASQWESGIPTSYIYQVHCQMLVMESDYAEIAVLKDGRNFSVLPIQRSEILCREIIEKCEDFYYNRLVPARKEAQAKGYTAFGQPCPEIVSHLEPPPDDSEAYEMFIKGKYSNSYEKKERELTDTEIGWLIKYEGCHNSVKEQERLKQEAKNKILFFMEDNEKLFKDKTRVIYYRRSESRKKEYFDVHI